jgi:hypothetical protein
LLDILEASLLKFRRETGVIIMTFILTFTALSFVASAFVVSACALSSRLSQREGYEEVYAESSELSSTTPSPVSPFSAN